MKRYLMETCHNMEILVIAVFYGSWSWHGHFLLVDLSHSSIGLDIDHMSEGVW